MPLDRRTHVRSRSSTHTHTRHTHVDSLTHTSGSGRCPSAFRGPPPLMLPGAALGSLAARFCWQGQHFRLWTVPERVSGPPPLDAARRSTWQTVPERVSGPPPLDAAPLDAARRSTWQPRGSFLLAGAALQALDSTRARFGAPPP